MENLVRSSHINGIDLFNWFYFGAQDVRSNKKYLNSINVFPVADGDTGTNLATTLHAMVSKPNKRPAFAGMLQEISETGLANARGNSGMIFASYVNGLAIEGRTYETVNIKEFSNIAYRALHYLYQAVEHPVEGTMITVIRDWATFLFHNHPKYTNFQDLLRDAYQFANVSLSNTTSQLEALRKNKVVDSGAAGFVKFLKGINHFFTGGKTAHIETEETDFTLPAMEEEKHAYRYCTEVLIDATGTNPSDNDTQRIQDLKDHLHQYGDSVIVLSQGNKIRVHLHTNTPEIVVASLIEYGFLLEQKVDDMTLQNSVKVNRKHPIGLLTDSIADLPDEYKLAHQIHTLPLSLLMDDVVYLDKQTIKLPQLFAGISTSETYPTSSQPETGRIRNFLENLLETYDSLIFVIVSSKLSGTYQVISQELKKIDTKGKKVTLIDSLLNSGAQGLLVKKASELLDQGFSHEKIVSQIEALIPKTKIYVCLETLANAVRSGRVPNTVGRVGMKIGLRPIMTIDSKGNGAAFGAAFSKRGITKKIMKLVRKTIQQKGIQQYSIVHADNLELALEYQKELTNMIGKEPEFITDIASVVALHSGSGSVAVCLTER